MTVLPPDIGLLWKGLRTAWLADPVLALLLDQSNQGGSIYLESPTQKVAFPIFVISTQKSDINTEASYLGVSWETLRINSYSLDRFHGGKVFAAFQQQWSIPRTRDEFSTTDWRVTDMYWEHPVDLGKLRITNIEQDVWGFACSCRLRVNRRT